MENKIPQLTRRQFFRKGAEVVLKSSTVVAALVGGAACLSQEQSIAPKLSSGSKVAGSNQLKPAININQPLAPLSEEEEVNAMSRNVPENKMEFREDDVEKLFQQFTDKYRLRDEDANILKLAKPYIFLDQTFTMEYKITEYRPVREKGIVVKSSDGNISVVLTVRLQRSKKKVLSEIEMIQKDYPYDTIFVEMIDKNRKEYVRILYSDDPKMPYLSTRLIDIPEGQINANEKNQGMVFSGIDDGPANQEDYEQLINVLQNGHVNTTATNNYFNYLNNIYTNVK